MPSSGEGEDFGNELVVVESALASPGYNSIHEACGGRYVPDHQGIGWFPIYVEVKRTPGLIGGIDTGRNRIIPRRGQEKAISGPSPITDAARRSLVNDG